MPSFPGLVLGFPAIPFSNVFRVTGAILTFRPFLSAFGRVPLAFALGFGFLGFGMHPQN